MSQHDSGPALVVRNPYLPFAVAMAAGGAVIALLAGGLVFSDFGTTLAALRDSRLTVPLAVRAVRLAIAAGWGLWGLNALLTGLRHLGSVYAPPGAPRDFASADEVIASLTRQDLPVYRLPDGGALGLARRYFSDLVPWLTERPRRVLEDNVAFARTTLLVTVLAMLAWAGLDALRVNVRGAYFADGRIGFPLQLVMLLWVLTTVKVASLFMMLPTASPPTEVIEERPAFRGAGNPFNLPGVIESALLPFRWRETPNRCHRYGFAQEQGGVADTGLFRGLAIVETQPVPYDAVRSPAVMVFVVCAIPLLLVGLWYSCLATPREPQSPADVVWLAGTMAAGLYLGGVGGGFLRHAHWLLGSFRFNSVLLLCRVEGSFARGEARLGRSALDTAEAGVVDVRSDGQCELYACRAVSESYTLEGQRHIIGLVFDEEIVQAVAAVRAAVAGFESERVAMRAPDLQRAEAGEIERLNLGHVGSLAAAGTPLMVPPATGPVPLALGAGPTRECPHCCEPVPAGAARCPHCDEPLPTGTALLPGPDDKLCPHCGQPVKRQATKCKHCKARLD